MNTRFRPSLVTFEDRLNLSPLLPAGRVTVPEPRPEPIVVIEYLVLGVVPAAVNERESGLVYSSESGSMAKTSAGSLALADHPRATAGGLRGEIEIHSFSWGVESPAPDDVWVDGRIITAESNATSAGRQFKEITITKKTDTIWPTGDNGNETITVGANHTESHLLLPAVQKVREAATRI